MCAQNLILRIERAAWLWTKREKSCIVPVPKTGVSERKYVCAWCCTCVVHALFRRSSEVEKAVEVLDSIEYKDHELAIAVKRGPVGQKLVEFAAISVERGKKDAVSDKAFEGGKETAEKMVRNDGDLKNSTCLFEALEATSTIPSIAEGTIAALAGWSQGRFEEQWPRAYDLIVDIIFMTRHSIGLCYKKTVECFTAAVGQCTRDIGDGTQAIEKLNGFEGADLIERLKHLIVAIGAFNKTVLPNLISVKAANAALAQLCEALQGLHVAVDNTIVGKFVTDLKD